MEKTLCACGEACYDKKCSIKTFLEKHGTEKGENENVIDYVKRLGFVSSHCLFPIWDKKYNGTKNKIHKFIFTSKKHKCGTNYIKISSKTHPVTWKKVKNSLDCHESSWSTVYLDPNLYLFLKQKILAGKWGNVAGTHENSYYETLFNIGNEKEETKEVKFNLFLESATKFYHHFPLWKSIQKEMASLPVGDHKKVEATTIESWIKDILSVILNKRSLDQKKIKQEKQETKEEEKQEEEKNEIHQEYQEFKEDSMIDRETVELFFRAFSGLASTIRPLEVPTIELKTVQAPIEKILGDLYNFWSSSSILSLDKKRAEELLCSPTIKNGTYLIRISQNYLWELAKSGINEVLKNAGTNNSLGPFVICFKNKEGQYTEIRITLQTLLLITLTDLLNFKQDIYFCYHCNNFINRKIPIHLNNFYMHHSAQNQKKFAENSLLENSNPTLNLEKKDLEKGSLSPKTPVLAVPSYSLEIENKISIENKSFEQVNEQSKKRVIEDSEKTNQDGNSIFYFINFFVLFSFLFYF